MKKIVSILILLSFYSSSYSQTFGELPPFTKWYENPLGVYPLELHTSNAILIPAVALTVSLLLTKKDSSLAHRFSLYEEGGFSWGYFVPNTSVYQNNVGFLYHPRKWVAIGTTFNAYHFRDGFNNTWGFGIRPVIRWYPLNKERFRLFFESGAGLIRTEDEFPQPTTGYGEFSEPRTGTHWNGSPIYGIGAEVSFDPRFSMQVGVRHVHISNGNTKGKDRNPGHDSNGFFIGFLYKLQKRSTE